MNFSIMFHENFNEDDGFIMKIFSRHPGNYYEATSIILFNAPNGKPNKESSLVSIKIIQFSIFPG